MLTENEVQRSFRNLFKSKDVPPDTFDKAEALLEELRAESPLRHRLSVELEEIRTRIYSTGATSRAAEVILERLQQSRRAA